LKSFQNEKNAFKKSLQEILQLLRICLREKTTIEGNEVKQIIKSLEETFIEFRNFKKELEELLEIIEKITDEEGRSFIFKFRNQLLGKDLNNWLKDIERSGLNLAKKTSSEFLNTFDRNKFKILENTRLEKFDQVIFILERIFFSTNLGIPLKLIELLADVSIPSEVKKSAVYLFLAALEEGRNKNQTVEVKK
jgi:TnpA family transposase